MDTIKTNASKIVTIILLTILLAAPIISSDLYPGKQLLQEQTGQKILNIAGTFYYVDGTAGNDSYPGTQSLPWRTIQKAANTLVAGDKVIVMGGIYNERVSETDSSFANANARVSIV